MSRPGQVGPPVGPFGRLAVPRFSLFLELPDCKWWYAPLQGSFPKKFLTYRAYRFGKLRHFLFACFFAFSPSIFTYHLGSKLIKATYIWSMAAVGGPTPGRINSASAACEPKRCTVLIFDDVCDILGWLLEFLGLNFAC